MLRQDLQLPFGAVYFRKSNPPKSEWERDYGVAREDGMNIFRHWFMWGSIERAPGVYDWSDYDRQMDLAAANGIKTIVAELIHAVPDWAMREFSHAVQVRADGTRLTSNMGVSAASGGFSNNGGGAGALTLNCPEVKAAAGRFLTALATRYKDHPSMYGYDVWNECNYASEVDYSAHAKAAFRVWLEAKYVSLEALAVAWNRYSYASWEDIEPPVQMAPYPECIDWQQFKLENFYGQMQWRIDTIRAVDPRNMISAHGVSGAIPNMTSNGCDDWRAAAKVELYGFTWIPARKGNEAWKNWYGVDVVRGAARGKPFWHAERQGGPLWLQPQVIGRDKDDGRVVDPEDIRVWCLTSLAGGARGVMNLRWRPLLDGPLFGAFGAYGMDGSRTPRSQMQTQLAKWANAPEQAALWQAKPVRGEIGILLVPETQQFDYLLMHERDEKPYPAAMWGAYRGFLDNGLQPDWVHIDDIDGYDCLYFPYPIMMLEAQAERLRAWVAAGGTLISEACPAYFGDRGHVGQHQPNFGLDEMFGAREAEVEFMPDIGDRIHFAFDGKPVDGGGLLQSYTVSGGTARGWFDDRRVSVVSHRHGAGRTLLVGTNPSVAYHQKGSADNLRFFADVFAWTGKEQMVCLTNPKVFARVHEGPEGRFLWLVNPTREAQLTGVRLASRFGAVRDGAVAWPAGAGSDGAGSDGAAPFVVGARDALVLRLG